MDWKDRFTHTYHHIPNESDYENRDHNKEMETVYQYSPSNHIEYLVGEIEHMLLNKEGYEVTIDERKEVYNAIRDIINIDKKGSL